MKSKSKPSKRTRAERSQTTTNTCGCGCGASPKSKGSRFVPGHDARMKPGSEWLKQHPERAGRQV